MTERDVPGLLKHFADLPDLRDPRGVRHELTDIVCIGILAVICGANSYSQIHQYALAQEVWLREFLSLPAGIPSQDTFERLFAVLSPDAWQSRFLVWTRSLVPFASAAGADEVLAVDGKSANGSACGGRALHTVSVWSSHLGIVLAQQQVPEKTDEITIIPELLEVVNPAGAVITTDALGCPVQVAWAAREHHAHYLSALKETIPRCSKMSRMFLAMPIRSVGTLSIATPKPPSGLMVAPKPASVGC